MHALINDIERYPEFVPGCTGARVLERLPDALVARLEVGRGPLRTAFTTRNRIDSGNRVTMELVEGPLRSLDGVWTLTPIERPGQPAGCRVTLDLSFELTGGLASLALGGLIERTAASLVDAFVRRARGS
jgi:ribosome-associated toxin RatA of RatAB toxin-antitoxin module